jgi:hypothetical protein
MDADVASSLACDLYFLGDVLTTRRKTQALAHEGSSCFLEPSCGGCAEVAELRISCPVLPLSAFSNAAFCVGFPSFHLGDLWLRTRSQSSPLHQSPFPGPAR